MLKNKNKHLVKIGILIVTMILLSGLPMTSFASDDGWTSVKINEPAPGTYNLSGSDIVVFKQSTVAFVWLSDESLASLLGDLWKHDASLKNDNKDLVYFTGDDTVDAVTLIEANAIEVNAMGPFNGLQFKVDADNDTIELTGKTISHITLIGTDIVDPEDENPGGGTTTEPAITTTEPAVTTTEPAVTTTEPAVTTTEPAVTTTEPAVTTTEPAVETTEPAVKTTESAVTTTPAVTATTGGNHHDSNNDVTVTEEAVPAAPVVEPADTPDEIVLDDIVPAGPLPQTGGFAPILLYGLGTLLAGTGFAVRRKNK